MVFGTGNFYMQQQRNRKVYINTKYQQILFRYFLASHNILGVLILGGRLPHRKLRKRAFLINRKQTSFTSMQEQSVHNKHGKNFFFLYQPFLFLAVYG
jgi:hypothetical protein